MKRRIINNLISKYLIGKISNKEKKVLQQWIELSNDNKIFFENVCESSSFSESYETYKGIDQNKAFDNFINITGQNTRKLWLKTWTKYAAVVVLLISLATPVYYFLQKNNIEVTPGKPKAILLSDDGSKINLEERLDFNIESDNRVIATNSSGSISYNLVEDMNSENKYNTIIIPRGGEYRITLSDGTKIHLNSESSLKYPIAFNDSVREVQLTGEAYFEIAKDKKRPFYVLTSDVKVKQYGTAFNVKNRSKDLIEVVLVHGSVSLLSDSFAKEQMLKPNQLATYSKATKKIVVSNVDIDPYVAWNVGKFIFSDMTLHEIMENLSLWYDVDFKFENESLERLRYTGNIPRRESLENILNAIEFTTEVKFALKDKMITVKNL